MEIHEGKQSLHDLAHNTVAIAKNLEMMANEMKSIKEVLVEIKEEMMRK